jgi:hypothetical protein
MRALLLSILLVATSLHGAGVAFTAAAQRVNTITPYIYNPDTNAALKYRVVGDDVPWADGIELTNSWPTRVGILTTNNAWAFGTKPVIKANILNGHKAVRFDGSLNVMSSGTAVSGSNLLFLYVGVKRDSALNKALMTIHDATADDYDSPQELQLYEFLSSTPYYVTTYRTAVKSRGLYPGTNVGFVISAKFDGTNNTMYLGDYPAVSVASTGVFNSTFIGLAAAHTSSGYNGWAKVDIAEVAVYESRNDTFRRDHLALNNSTYGLSNPRVTVCLGDSITASQWPPHYLTNYAVGAMYVEDLAVGGHNLDQVATDATDANLYNRIAARVNPEKTAVFVWEYVNAKNAGNTDQEIVNKTSNICVQVRSAGGKAIVATDFHDATSSVNCQGASALMAAQWANFADAIVDLNLQSLRDDSNNNSDTTHLTTVGNLIIAPLVKAAVDSLIP